MTSSCHNTGTPSLVTCTSNSTQDAPASLAAMNDATVFSRMPLPLQRFMPSPLCPMTAHPPGSRYPGKFSAYRCGVRRCAKTRLLKTRRFSR